ncbi:MAG: DUF421 domain-containing protein [Candidatus Dormibacteraceae bacterium]
MWTDLFVIQIPLVEKILRTVIVYAVILVLFRLIGKRGLAALNTFDFVVIFLLSNIVQNAIIGNDQSLLGGIVGAVTLVAVNAGLNRLAAWQDRFAFVFEGGSTTVIENGQVDERALRRLGITPQELDYAVRLQNGDDLSEIQDGRLDPGGHLVLTLKPEEQAATKRDVRRLEDRLATIERLLSHGAEGAAPV